MRGLSWRNFDFLLFGAVVLASAFGAMMIRSAIAGNTDLAGYDQRQAYFAVAGAAVIVLLASIDYRYWLSIHWPIYIVMMVMLMSLSGLGQAAFGAQRWFQVGVLFVQPTEFAKIIVILALARPDKRATISRFKWP
jgi:rod shape determining protein RodA